MTTTLGTLEELPLDYRRKVESEHLAPLWPMLRDVLPHHAPKPVSKPCLWMYERIRPLLMQAGELTPVEKAERRVLVLVDPGRGPGAMQVTSVIYCGLQLLLPGEVAPAHRHTPSAARVVIEGRGAYTVVDGEKCPMERGDLILTPGGMWHDHGHDGREPVVWLDALDLPLFVYLEGSYAKERELQKPKARPDASEVEYTAAGMLPARLPGATPPRYPMLRYPWRRTREALLRAAEHAPAGSPVELDYVNPETGESCLPTLGFAAMMLRAGNRLRAAKRSSSSVFHVIEGSGASTVNGNRFEWNSADTFSAPVFADVEHQAASEDAFLIRIHDAPLQQKLNFYEEVAR